MIAVFRTIAIVDLVFNALVFGLGWLFGLSPLQSIGAVLIMALTLGLVVGWRAVVRYANRPRQEWTYHRPPPRLPGPLPTYRIETPALRQIEAPGRELVKHS